MELECKNPSGWPTMLKEERLTRVEVEVLLNQSFISEIAFPGCNLMELRLEGRFGPILEISSIREEGVQSMLFVRKKLVVMKPNR
jgi:hypothetical protein